MLSTPTPDTPHLVFLDGTYTQATSPDAFRLSPLPSLTASLSLAMQRMAHHGLRSCHMPGPLLQELIQSSQPSCRAATLILPLQLAPRSRNSPTVLSEQAWRPGPLLSLQTCKDGDSDGQRGKTAVCDAPLPPDSKREG